jgi:hypothetical protein
LRLSFFGTTANLVEAYNFCTNYGKGFFNLLLDFGIGSAISNNEKQVLDIESATSQYWFLWFIKATRMSLENYSFSC